MLKTVGEEFSKGNKSGDLVGNLIGYHLPIHHPKNYLSKIRLQVQHRAEVLYLAGSDADQDNDFGHLLLFEKV